MQEGERIRLNQAQGCGQKAGMGKSDARAEVRGADKRNGFLYMCAMT